MTRIKTVYSSDMVVHLWANRHPHDIRNPGNSLFTRGACLHSYGSHHVIAAFLDKPAKGGESLLLWNQNRHSSTTGRHHDIAWRALSKDQRESITRVPGMRADDVTPHGLPGLAKACIKAAITPLEKSAKARENRPFLIAEGVRFLESARKIYAYLGNEKAAQGVPRFTGQDTPSKPEVLQLLQGIAREEYALQARENRDRAGAYMADCVNTIEAYTLDPTLRHGGKDYGINARRVLQLAKGVIQHGDIAKHAYKQAGLNVPPSLVRIMARARTLQGVWASLAHAEDCAEWHKDSLGNLPNVLHSLHGFKHGKRSGLSLRFYLERVRIPNDAQTLAQVFTSESERETVTSVYARARRVLFGASMHEAIKETRASLVHYREMMQAGKTVEPASPSILRSVCAKWPSVQGYPLPDSLAQDCARLITEAEQQKAEHAAMVAMRDAEKIAAWRAGESVQGLHSVPVMIRIHDDTVQTSRGAVVPLEHAARLVRIAERVSRNGGAEYGQGEGPIVGHFRVNRIGADMSAVIGCHDISADESAHAVALIKAAMGERMPQESTNS